MVVAVAVDPLDEHPVGTAIGLREPVDPVGVHTGEDRGGPEGERGGGAGVT